MLIDGFKFLDTSFIEGAVVDSGTSFPSSPVAGQLFYLSAVLDNNDKGLYVYNGTTWTTGDVTRVTAGTGLVGGGSGGDVTLSLDPSAIPTPTAEDLGLGSVENKSSATIRSEITSSNVTTALGFTPYNSTNPTGYVTTAGARGALSAGTGISYNSSTGVITSTVTGTGVANDMNENVLSNGMMRDMGLVFLDKGNSGTTTQTFNYTQGSHQRLQVTGAHTIATSNWPPTGNLGELLIELVNGAAFAVTWPTINWVKNDGTTTTTFASNGVTLQASGTDWILLWTRNAGTTIYGKVMR